MKRSPRPRKTAELSKSLHQQLNMYALAASAAGVGLLALAQPVEAKIIYTKTHRVIGTHDVYRLDLNHDKKIDFILGNTNHCTTAICRWALWASRAASGNNVMGFHSASGWWYASALRAGDIIDSGGRFDRTVGVMAGVQSATFSSSGQFGKWVNVNNRYLGFRFGIHGKTHYGWARLNVTVNGKVITGMLTGYAYETIAGKAIVAGKTKGSDATMVSPATLGHLAAGGSAIPVRRSNQTAATTH